MSGNMLLGNLFFQIEEKLEPTLHDIDVARINLFTLRQSDAEVRETMTNALNDVNLSISMARGPYEDDLIRAKSTLERKLEQHDAQHEANVREVNTELRELLYHVETLRLAKLMMSCSEELKNWSKREEDWHSEEHKAKLKEGRKLIGAHLDLLRRYQEEQGY